ncbi:MAG: sigma-70 family RNA polymerase sigma factor [Brevundimonas sp.]|uniref:RNA polymerase sigma factor n=1 Tax=Brevundimonas sp. TaxID=1871086 RepID=UPI0025C155CA|nr:sigma-70 family RNA polymerase sigma factor [Brevundimonas sp.]MCH4269661.1 sigma-70 family RNA polymerase sigma factor [Brevundimonas sp.]
MSDGLDELQPDAPLSLEGLYGRYAQWFRARLIRRYGAQDAEDLAQEAWLRMAPYQAKQAVRHPQALLLRIAANLMADRYAGRFRRDRHAREVSDMDGFAQEPASQIDVVLTRQLVLGLPQPLRDVFVLSRVSGLSNNQIAEQLGISPKTVEKRMTKAKAHCAAQLRL